MNKKLNSIPSAGTEVDSSTKADVTTSSHNSSKPRVGSSAFGTLFELAAQTETCRNCEHRQRHQMGLSIIQYCGVRSSNRTDNGLLKIKCKTPACSRFKQM